MDLMCFLSLSPLVVVVILKQAFDFRVVSYIAQPQMMSDFSFGQYFNVCILTNKVRPIF